MTTQLLTANDLQQLARITKLNDTKLKEFLIDVGLHRATATAKALGYSSPYMIYHWLNWSKGKLPVINDLYNDKVDLRKDPERLDQLTNEVIDTINELKGQLNLFFN